MLYCLPFFCFRKWIFFISVIWGFLLLEVQRHYTYSKENKEISRKNIYFYFLLSHIIVIWAQSDFNEMKNYAYFCGFFFFLLLWEVNIKIDGKIKKFLESRSIQFLGKISFQIYGLHFLIIRSLGAFLINMRYSNNIYGWVFVYCISFLTTIVLSVILNKMNLHIQNSISNQILKVVEKQSFSE